MKTIHQKSLFLFFSSVIFSFTLAAQSTKNINLENYFQEVKTDINLPSEAGKNAIKLLLLSGTKVAITSNSVCKFKDGKWSSKIYSSTWKTAAVDPNGKIWLASAKTIQEENSTSCIALPTFAQNDTILCLHWENAQNLLVGTTNGLLCYSGKWEALPFTKGKRINAITADAKNDLWLATNDGLLRRMAGKWINMDDNLMAYGLKRTYFALESRLESKELLFGGLFAVGCLAENSNHWILRGADGLPYGPITSVKTFGNDLWLGTPKGVIKKDPQWHYYCGKRWMPSDQINDILPIDEHKVWIATPEGISQIQEVEMSLEQKAAAFEERIRLRHDRYGLVSGSRLTTSGDLSTSQTRTDDNDGLWTSIYLAAECFRYSVTKSPEAKANAIKAYEAMERLETITGIPGFPARSFVVANESTGEGGEWHLTTDKKWKWKGDTSSDEMVGHLFALPLFHDLVAEGPLKERSRKLVHRIMTHIVDNNFHLIDLDGKPTRWAVWSPDSLNYKHNWMYEQGINSLQILAFLKAGYQITGDTKFESAYQNLVKNHHYVENMIQQKMYGPLDINHSDDELAFLPYYTLFRYAKDPELLPFFQKSIQRSWNVEQADRIPIWNIISSVALKKDCDLSVAVEELQQIPVDLISWTMKNSHRWDLQQDQLTDRFGKPQATRPIPTPERAISKWNYNTYQYDAGSNGFAEDDGAYFLLPFWMGRYHNLFVGK
ncbi:MAG: hypothetical protein JNK09_15445 [Prolixibacteraceae bacterium]|nr:hypothetical protein [Prolixibacteraceae bacterium]